ncbi:MAG: sporulation integral membrane protein YlbJ [Lutispora sp.]|nr:sporulation integral membrane protein YlbJ [Lutispora sp.]
MIKKYLTLYFNALLFLFIISSIIMFPEEAYRASLEGLDLWFNVVCPALLPFFICVEILIGLGVVSFIGSIFKPLMSIIFNMPGEGAFAFVMSIASGYPVGAKIVANLRRNNQCTKTEAQRMISLCSTSGPLFIIGAVSIGMLKNPQATTLLLLSHYFSAISCGLIMKFYKRDEKSKYKLCISNPFKELLLYRETDNRTIGQLMGDSIKNAISLILLVGGYIIIFSVISRIIKVTGILTLIIKSINLLPLFHIQNIQKLSVIVTGILEITNGIKECADVYTPGTAMIALVSFFIGFGGLSINAQVSGIIQDTDINFSIFFIMKILQGFLAAIYTFLLSTFANLPAFSIYPFYSNYDSIKWYNTLMLSSRTLVFLLLFLLLSSSLISLFFFSLYNKK